MALTDKDILARLDQAWLGGTGDFTGTMRSEYHALRLIAGRAVVGDDWFVVLERVLGSFIDDLQTEPLAAAIHTTAFGPRVDARSAQGELPRLRELRDLRLVASERNTRALSIEGILVQGPGGPLACEDAMIAEHDLRPGLLTNLDQTAENPVDVLLIRAYLAAYPNGLFYPVADVGALLELGPDEAYVTIVSAAFEHVIGRDPESAPWDWDRLEQVSIQPSESETYRSLAFALEARDPSKFRPGTPNTDWRNWARFEDVKALRDAKQPRP